MCSFCGKTASNSVEANAVQMCVDPTVLKQETRVCVLIIASQISMLHACVMLVNTFDLNMCHCYCILYLMFTSDKYAASYTTE